VGGFLLLLAAATGLTGYMVDAGVPQTILEWVRSTIHSRVAFLLALRLWWGYEADRRLNSAIESWRQAGQLVFVSEFNAQLYSVPGDQNAAILYEEAFPLINETTASGLWMGALHELGENQYRTQVAEIVANNAKPLELARRARSRPLVAWSSPLSPDNRGPNGSGQRSLCRLLRVASRHYLLLGNHRQALETLHDAFRLAGNIQQYPRSVSSMTAEGCVYSTLADAAALILAISNTVTDDGPIAHPVSPDQLRSLLNELNDEAIWLEYRRRGYFGDRAMFLELAITSRERKTTLASIIRGPAFALDALATGQQYTQAAFALDEPTWRDAIGTSGECHPYSRTLLAMLANPISDMPYERSEDMSMKSLRSTYFRLANIRLCKTALAISLYQLDNGCRPQTLIELVPEYLASVPIDPMSTDATLFRYVADNTSPLVYSVGLDGVDNRGTPMKYPHPEGDLVFYLGEQPADSQSPVQTDKDQNDKDNAHRKDSND